jgi:hypothetical protein
MESVTNAATPNTAIRRLPSTITGLFFMPIASCQNRLHLNSMTDIDFERNLKSKAHEIVINWQVSFSERGFHGMSPIPCITRHACALGPQGLQIDGAAPDFRGTSLLLIDCVRPLYRI